MAILLDQFKRAPGESFFIGIFQDNLDKNVWHYHREYEISFITEGIGKRIVGDSIEEFSPGDLIFIGPRLPHAWIPEPSIHQLSSGRTLESVYLLFDQSIMASVTASLPEFSNVNNALRLSERGIKITGETLAQVSEIMLQLPYLDTFTRLIYLYKILDILGRSEAITVLASENYMKTTFRSGNKRMNMIHEFLMDNYREEISLEKLAGMVNMAKGSFCRFFKSQTNLTVFEYLNRIKVDYACKLLMNSDMTIITISYDCGFNNLSHFNKQFKKCTGTTPSQYRKQFIGC